VAAKRNQSGRRRGVDEEVSEKSPGNKAIPGFCVLEKALSGLPEPLGWKRMQKTDPVGATARILVRAVNPKWKFRFTVIVTLWKSGSNQTAFARRPHEF
jgi:hypothetical protein